MPNATPVLRTWVSARNPAPRRGRVLRRCSSTSHLVHWSRPNRQDTRSQRPFPGLRRRRRNRGGGGCAAASARGTSSRILQSGRLGSAALEDGDRRRGTAVMGVEMCDGGDTERPRAFGGAPCRSSAFGAPPGLRRSRRRAARPLAPIRCRAPWHRFLGGERRPCWISVLRHCAPTVLVPQTLAAREGLSIVVCRRPMRARSTRSRPMPPMLTPPPAPVAVMGSNTSRAASTAARTCADS